MASFEKFKSDLNQTWLIDIMFMQSNVIYQGQRSSEVKL